MLPASLQVLKDRAKAAQQEEKQIAQAEDTQWRQALLDVAKESLRPVWEYVTTKPTHYQPWEATFEICIPGHRRIYAHFGVLNSGSAFWTRTPYYGARASDVEGEHAYWMVDARPGKDLPSYHHTLGAALAEAEVKHVGP